LQSALLKMRPKLLDAECGLTIACQRLMPVCFCCVAFWICRDGDVLACWDAACRVFEGRVVEVLTGDTIVVAENSGGGYVESKVTLSSVRCGLVINAMRRCMMPWFVSALSQNSSHGCHGEKRLAA
jgi:hypothetical protein